MANVKISLSENKSLNNVNLYSDVDINSDFIENTLMDRKSIENSINNLLTWKPRERIMNPGLGNTLWKRIFDNMSTMGKSEIRREVSNILSYEPRIKVEDINVEMNINNSEMYISFTYSIPSLDKSGKGKQLNEFSVTISMN